MKYAAVAVAVAGVAAADSTLSVAWEPVPTTTASTTWTTWDPKPTTTWTTWDPKETTTTSSWSAWEPVSESSSSSSTWTTWDPKKTTTTSWSAWDPKKTTTTSWSAWDPKKTSTTTSSWSAWEPVSESSSSSSTWTTWDPKTTTTASWSAWEGVSDTTTKKTKHTKSTPAADTETVTWSTWESADYTTTVKSTVTETSSTWASWSVVTSDVTPAWSSNGWFGGAWPTAKAGECVSNVVSSYGYPIWKPTPEATTTVTWTSSAKKTSSASSTWSASKGASTGHAEIAPNGKKWSMTYSLYTSSSACKAQSVIEAEIKEIASLGFTSVRVYSTDCYTLEYVGAACKANNLSIILGVFIDKAGVSGAGQQVKDIVAWGQWEIVELVVIGNEAVFQGFCSASELAGFISSSKATFAAAGYTGPCTTTEPLEQWQQYSSEFCGAVDVVGANLYAFFNADCTAENAGTFIESEISILEGLCSGKKPYVMECGWPSEGQCNGAACPSPENQKTAILAIEETCGESIVFFSFEDDVWKAPGQFGVEQHWGCSGVFGGSSPAATSTATWAPVAATSTSTSSWAAWTTY